MIDDITQAREQAREHEYIGWSLVGFSLVFLVGVGLFVPQRDWLAVVLALAGAIGFAYLARREWAFADQWNGCADLWEMER